MMETVLNILVLLATAMLTGLGVMSMLAPRRMVDNFALDPKGVAGLSSIRSVIGGFRLSQMVIPDDVRDQLGTIIAEVTATRNAESTAVNAAAKESVIEAGGVVRALTDEQRAAWVETMKPVWEQFKGDVGEDNIAAAQAINAKH